MTLAAIAEILAERDGKQFNTAFQEEMKDLIVVHTARVITNKLEKSPHYAKFYSKFIIADLEEVNKDECEDLTNCPCKDVKRTKLEIPQPIKSVGNPFTYVGAPGGYQAYGWTTFGSEPYLASSNVTGKKTRYTWINNRIYIFNDLNVEQIRIEAPWSDKRLLANFSCSMVDFVPCYKDTDDYIEDEAIAQIVIERILSTELRKLSQGEKIQVKEDKLI